MNVHRLRAILDLTAKHANRRFGFANGIVMGAQNFKFLPVVSENIHGLSGIDPIGRQNTEHRNFVEHQLVGVEIVQRVMGFQARDDDGASTVGSPKLCVRPGRAMGGRAGPWEAGPGHRRPGQAM